MLTQDTLARPSSPQTCTLLTKERAREISQDTSSRASMKVASRLTKQSENSKTKIVKRHFLLTNTSVASTSNIKGGGHWLSCVGCSISDRRFPAQLWCCCQCTHPAQTPQLPTEKTNVSEVHLPKLPPRSCLTHPSQTTPSATQNQLLTQRHWARTITRQWETQGTGLKYTMQGSVEAPMEA